MIGFCGAQVVAEKEAEMALRLSELTREMERAHANELSEKLALAERQVYCAANLLPPCCLWVQTHNMTRQHKTCMLWSILFTLLLLLPRRLRVHTFPRIFVF